MSPYPLNYVILVYLFIKTVERKIRKYVNRVLHCWHVVTGEAVVHERLQHARLSHVPGTSDGSTLTSTRIEISGCLRPKQPQLGAFTSVHHKVNEEFSY